MQLDHINVSAPMELLEKVKEFYCTVFELENGFRPAFGKGGFWLYSGENPIIHLSQSNAHHPAENRGCLDHVAFRATGLQALVDRLESQQLAYRASHIPELNMTQLFFSDPAGTGLEVNFLNETL